jgi:hypothetical protein
MLPAVDLHGCDRSRLQDPDGIRGFVPSLLDAIDVAAHAPLMLERFGDGDLEGWSSVSVDQCNRALPGSQPSTGGGSCVDLRANRRRRWQWHS